MVLFFVLPIHRGFFLKKAMLSCVSRIMQTSCSVTIWLNGRSHAIILHPLHKLELVYSRTEEKLYDFVKIMFCVTKHCFWVEIYWKIIEKCPGSNLKKSPSFILKTYKIIVKVLTGSSFCLSIRNTSIQLLCHLNCGDLIRIWFKL